MAYGVLRHTLVPLLRHRVQAEGLHHLPTSGPYIIAANHQSYLDPPAVWLAVVPHIRQKLWFITTEYVWRGLKKIFRQRGIEWLGILPIFQSQRAAVLDLAVQELLKGERVVIFPEGTRNRNQEPVLLKGKTGLARLALATGAPIIPVGVIAPAGLTTNQAIRNFFFSRQPAIIRVGEPLQFDRIDGEISRTQLDSVTTEVMVAIGRLCHKRYEL